jgi:hypothetical protein
MRIKDIFSAKNIRNFVEGNINILKDKTNFMKLDQHIKEQAIYRASLCIECLDNGACLVCGCGTPQMFYAPKKLDSKEKWGEMLDKDEWNKYKEENNITIPNIDLAAMEVDAKYNEDSLKFMPPWERKRLLNNLADEVKKNKEDEPEG